MASIMAGFARSVIANSSTSVSQALALDRRSAFALGSLIKSKAKRHWKTAVVVGTCGALIAGAYKVHCDVVAWREQQDLALEGEEVGLMSSLHTLEHVSSERVNTTLEAIGCTPNTDFETEIEDVLELDPPKVECMRQLLEAPTDEEGNELITEAAKHKRDRKERKRVKQGAYGVALKSLVAKAKLAFPVPKSNELHIQAVNLYLHKECRKLNLRVSDAARLIPQAVALAIIPSDPQIIAGQIAGIPSIQKRYLQRQWKEENPSLPVRVVNSILSWSRK